MRTRECVLIALSLGIFPGAAFADFTKTITVSPGMQINAVTTWYYANCDTSLGLGTYSMKVAPKHGVVTFADLSGPLPGCPAGSPALPAVAAYYTWTDTETLETADYFQLEYMVNGLAQADDISVNLAAPTTGESCATILTSRTVVSVPEQPDSRTTIGVAEIVELNTTYPANWFINGEGILNEPSSGNCSLSTSATPVQGTAACFTAPYARNRTTITAELEGGGSCSIDFNTIQPSGLIFQRVIGPGYAYQDPNYVASIGMFSVAFLTPGTVSFANVGIAEQDHPIDSDNFIAPPYTPPVLVRVNPSTNAWLIGCDKDVEPRFPGFYVSNWVYTWGSSDYVSASKRQFATVETQVTFPLFVWLFQKGQIQTGIFNTFINPTATLAVPSFSSPSVMGTLNRASCLSDITNQFGIVPMSK